MILNIFILCTFYISVEEVQQYYNKKKGFDYLDLNIFDRKNNTLQDNSNNFVKSFINELKDYLDKNIFKNIQNNRNLTYAVASEPNDKGKVFVTARNGTGAGKDFKLSELPKSSQFGTILR